MKFYNYAISIIIIKFIFSKYYILGINLIDTDLNKLKLAYRINRVSCHLLSQMFSFVERTFLLRFINLHASLTVFLIIRQQVKNIRMWAKQL